MGEELTHWKGVIKGPDGGDFKLHFHQLFNKNDFYHFDLEKIVFVFIILYYEN